MDKNQNEVVKTSEANKDTEKLSNLEQTQGIDTDIAEVMTQIQESDRNKIHIINKRIDFDKKTMKRLNTMLPLYSDEAGEGIKESELYSYVVRVAVNTLFEGDFKKKLDEL